MKKLAMILTAALLAVSAVADPADPQISNVRLEQDGATRRVTVQYDLDERAVVTMDVLTNGVSIGGANIQGVMGDCFKIVSAGSDHIVTWDPHHSWPDHKFGAGVVSVRMTAWALDNTPDYMAVDISDAAQSDTQAYYPDADFVLGGVTNGLYKTTKLLMRKIMAKGVEWTMGSTALETQRNAAREATHQVTLTNNYYIGVFEVTQAQWALIYGNYPSYYYNLDSRAMRPVESVNSKFVEIRTNGDDNHLWPAPPHSNSFLGKLRLRTGIDFDLPGEAQWEFAARAGNGDTKWGDGSGIKNSATDSNLNRLSRYKWNDGCINGNYPPQNVGATNGTAIVGSYAPNDWGLYDMAGNVGELCLDWFEDDIGAYGGKVNVDPSDPLKTLSRNAGDKHVLRGGVFWSDAASCRPAWREDSGSYSFNRGLRVVCTAGLK